MFQTCSEFGFCKYVYGIKLIKYLVDTSVSDQCMNTTVWSHAMLEYGAATQ